MWQTDRLCQDADQKIFYSTANSFSSVIVLRYLFGCVQFDRVKKGGPQNIVENNSFRVLGRPRSMLGQSLFPTIELSLGPVQLQVNQETKLMLKGSKNQVLCRTSEELPLRLEKLQRSQSRKPQVDWIPLRQAGKVLFPPVLAVSCLRGKPPSFIYKGKDFAQDRRVR